MATRWRALTSLCAFALVLTGACGGGNSSSPAQNSSACSSLAGTWYTNQLQSGTNTQWSRATQTIAADCTVTTTAFLNSSGNTSAGSAWTMSIDSSGILSRADVPTWRGMPILNDTVLVSTRTAGDNVSVNLTLSFKAGSAFTQNDIAGTMAVRLLRAGASPLWAYLTVVIDSAGNTTSTWTDSTGASAPGTPTVYTVASDGSVTESGNAMLVGRVSSGKELMSATDTKSAGSYDLIVGTPASTGFVTSDLAGTWRYHRLQVGAGSHWARGRVSADTSGAVTQLSFGDSNGNSTPGAGFTCSIDSSGAITRADDTTYRGQMLASKNVIIAVQSNGAGDSYRLIIYRKE